MLFKIIQINSYNIKNFCKLHCEVGKIPRIIKSTKFNWKSTNDLRANFIDYFKMAGHTIVEPCSVIRRDNQSYFVNSGVSQFKNHILGEVTEFRDITRAVNSQRCIRLGGEKCDLENIGYDSIHLSFFEMLGNWSFQTYSKKEACRLMWLYLTECLQLPASHLYVTYFGGSEELGLPPDEETRDIWFNLGVKDNKILQFGENENFWELGPRQRDPICGPSTEIHWDYLATMNNDGVSRCARCFVNSGSPEVIELWNSVFIQYQWRGGGDKIVPLRGLIVDTGMGLERLASVVQGVTGVFDTDNFAKVIDHLGQVSGALPYAGTFSVKSDAPISTQMHLENVRLSENMSSSLRRDVAYRIISDHLRSLCVCIYDGLQPGRQGVDLKIRQLLHRAIRQSRYGLGMDGGLSAIIDTVCDTLEGQIHPTEEMKDEVKKIIELEEKRFLPKLELIDKAFEKFIHSRKSITEEINATEINQLNSGVFGCEISFNMIRAIAKDVGIPLSNKILDDNTDKVWPSDSESIFVPILKLLSDKNVPPTRTSQIYNVKYNESNQLYEVENVDSTVLLVLLPLNHEKKLVSDVLSFDNVNKFGLVTEETNMFAEKGGQGSDNGSVLCNGKVVANVNQVEWNGKHVIHWCEVVDPSISLSPSDKITLHVFSHHRTGTTLHHTAQHVIFNGIKSLVGNINQASCNIRHNYAKFGFNIDPVHGNRSILEQPDFTILLENFCKRIIEDRIPVEIQNDIPVYQVNQDENIHSFRPESLPSHVRIVSIDNYKETCCGTHAFNTSHLQEIIVTSLKKVKQGTVEITFVTGSEAIKIVEKEKEMQKFCLTVGKKTIWSNKEIEATIEQLNKFLGITNISKAMRINVTQLIKNLHQTKYKPHALSKVLASELSSFNATKENVCIIHSDVEGFKKIVHIIMDMKISFPVLIYYCKKMLIYVPKLKVVDILPNIFDNIDCSSNQYMSDVPKMRTDRDTGVYNFAVLTFENQFEHIDQLKVNIENLIKKNLSES